MNINEIVEKARKSKDPQIKPLLKRINEATLNIDIIQHEIEIIQNVINDEMSRMMSENRKQLDEVTTEIATARRRGATSDELKELTHKYNTEIKRGKKMMDKLTQEYNESVKKLQMKLSKQFVRQQDIGNKIESIITEAIKVDPNKTKFEEHEIVSILGLDGLVVKNDNKSISYIRSEIDSITLYRAKLIPQLDGSVTVTKPTKLVVDKGVSTSDTILLSNLFGVRGDDNKLDQLTLNSIVGPNNSDIRNLTLEYDESGKLLNEKHLMDVGATHYIANNGFDANDSINTSNQIRIFNPIPLYKDINTRKTNSDKFKKFISQVYGTGNDISGDTILKAIVQCFVEYRTDNYLTFILKRSKVGDGRNIFVDLLKRIFNVDFNKYVKFELNKDEMIDFIDHDDNPYIHINMNSLNVNLATQVAKQVGIKFSNTGEITNKLYEYFGDYLFEEGFTTYYRILQQRKAIFYKYGMPVEVTKSLKDDDNTMKFPSNMIEGLLELIRLKEMSDNDFMNVYRLNKNILDYKSLRSFVKLNFIRLKEMKMLFNTYKIDANDVKKILIEYNILGISDDTVYVDGKTLHAKSFNIELLKDFIDNKSRFDIIESEPEIVEPTPIVVETEVISDPEELARTIEMLEREYDNLETKIQSITTKLDGVKISSDEYDKLNNELNHLIGYQMAIENRRFNLSLQVVH